MSVVALGAIICVMIFLRVLIAALGDGAEPGAAIGGLLIHAIG